MHTLDTFDLHRAEHERLLRELEMTRRATRAAEERRPRPLPVPTRRVRRTVFRRTLGARA